MKSIYCVGNWKLNKTPLDARQFVRNLREEVRPEEEERLVLLPPALSAFAVQESLLSSKIRWGGQNCCGENAGAFTGENSAAVFKEMGAAFCLVGHSERRHLFLESDELLAKKLALIQSNELTPILCLGETLDDRKWRRTKEVVLRQLRTGLQRVQPDRPLWVAYEPVWAIGTGQVATADQVEEAHSFIKQGLKELMGGPYMEATPILYGGSVKPENAHALGQLRSVDGFLVGGASLNPSDFLKIYRAATV